MFEDYKKIVISGPGPNALSPASLADLVAQLDAAGDAPLLLTGDGRAFSAGLDLTAVVTMTAADFEAFLSELEAFARRIFLHPAPTVAVLNGHCVAAGYMIAAACERRIAKATDNLKVGLPAVKLGLQYPPVLLAIIRYVIPTLYQEEVLLGSQAHQATRGLAMGMIEEIAEDPMERGLEWLEARATLPREAYALTKRTLRDGVTDISEAERKRFREEVVPSWADPERTKRMLKAIGK